MLDMTVGDEVSFDLIFSFVTDVGSVETIIDISSVIVLRDDDASFVANVDSSVERVLITSVCSRDVEAFFGGAVEDSVE